MAKVIELRPAPRIPRSDRLPPLQAALCGLTMSAVLWGAIFLLIHWFFH